MSEKLTKGDLTDKLAEKFDFTKVDSREIIEFILDEITGTLANEGEVSLYNFGKFEVKHRAARQGINPATKEKIQIAASKNPSFRAAKGLKDAVNEK